MDENSLRSHLEKALQDPELRGQLEKIIGGEEFPTTEALVKDLQSISDEDLAQVAGGTSYNPRALVERLVDPNIRDALGRLLGLR